MNAQTRKLTLPALVLGAALLAACSPAPQKSSAASAAPAPKPAPAQAAVVAAAPKPDCDKGKGVYMTLCVACHGPDAKGIPKLGKSLVESKFMAEKSDEELLNFVKVGRMPGDPLNTTGVAMPPKGGNPALQDGQIRDVIAYLRSIRQNTAATASSAVPTAPAQAPKS